MNAPKYITIERGGVRLRWVYDEDYQTVGSYGYDTEAETKAAEDEELDKLRSGKWVALGCIVEERAKCECPECDGWHETDSCWGIVIDGTEKSLLEYAEWTGWFKAGAA